jgi:uncharacterized membrane protein YqiK
LVSASVLMLTALLPLMMLAMLVLYALGYKKVAPNKVMVLFRGSPEKGSTVIGVVQGGGRFMSPGARNFRMLDINADILEFEMTGVPTESGGSPVTLRLRVAAIWRIQSEPEVLKASAGKLVERTHGENEMAVREQLERVIRNMSGGMSAASFETDMMAVRSKATNDADLAVADLGLQVVAVRFLEVRPQG